MTHFRLTVIFVLLSIVTTLHAAGVVEVIETPQSDSALAIEYYERGQNKDAILIYKRLISRYPLLPEPYINLAQIYIEEKHYGQGVAVLQAFLKYYPDYQPAKSKVQQIHNIVKSVKHQRTRETTVDNSKITTSTSKGVAKPANTKNYLPAKIPLKTDMMSIPELPALGY